MAGTSAGAKKGWANRGKGKGKKHDVKALLAKKPLAQRSGPFKANKGKGRAIYEADGEPFSSKREAAYYLRKEGIKGKIKKFYESDWT